MRRRCWKSNEQFVSALNVHYAARTGRLRAPRHDWLLQPNRADVRCVSCGLTVEARIRTIRGFSCCWGPLSEPPLAAAEAEAILRVLRSSGRPAPRLQRLLELSNRTLGKVPDFSPELVHTLVAEAQTRGDATRGRRVYERPAMSCASCHQIEGVGGKIGPDLSATGTSIPPARLVEEIIWPARQVKDGFSLLQVTLEDGSLMMGYRKATRNDKILQLQDLTTGEITRIARNRIKKTQDAGSAMPPSLAAQLTHQELLDLIRYLLDLGSK